MDGLRGGGRMPVGSLPFTDPQDAVQFQLEVFTEIPAWPQLPRRSPREKMNLQGLSGLPGLSWPSPEQPVWTLAPGDIPEALEFLKAGKGGGKAAFKAEEAAGFYAFLKAKGSAAFQSAMAVKGQCAGPVTLGLSILEEQGLPLLRSKESMGVLVQYLLLHAKWQIQQLRSLHSQVVFFLDEPSLGAGFNPSGFGLEWVDIQGWLRQILEPLQEVGVLTGIHCCGRGPWNWALETSQEFFHFDAFNHIPLLMEQAPQVGSFLEKGGMLVWGMIPTALTSGDFPDTAVLLKRWDDAFEAFAKRGVPKKNLIEQSYFSTSCGLGHTPLPVARQASKTLQSFVTHWRSIYSAKPGS